MCDNHAAIVRIMRRSTAIPRIWMVVLVAGTLGSLPRGVSAQETDASLVVALREARRERWVVRVPAQPPDLPAIGRVLGFDDDSVRLEGVVLALADIDRLERLVERGGGGTRGAAIGATIAGLAAYTAMFFIPVASTGMDVALHVAAAAAVGGFVGWLLGSMESSTEMHWLPVWSRESAAARQ
jgi:hypothetical protein